MNCYYHWRILSPKMESILANFSFYYCYSNNIKSNMGDLWSEWDLIVFGW